MVKNCAFQYWDGRVMKSDVDNITLDVAKSLFNDFYDDMVCKVMSGEMIEVAIWIDMRDDTDYNKTLIHLFEPEVKNGLLSEPKFYPKFK